MAPLAASGSLAGTPAQGYASDQRSGPGHAKPSGSGAEARAAPLSGGHDHGVTIARRARRHSVPLALLAAAMGLVAIGEAVGGTITGSLALLADAAHAMTDVLSLSLALAATWMVARASASPQKTFGYYRAEILAAFANAVLLGVLAVFIVIEAIERAAGGAIIDGAQTATIGVVVLGLETVGLFVLHRIQGESLNARSAFLHLLGDATSTMGVIVAGVVIAVAGNGWAWLDAAVSFGIAALLGFWAIRLIQETSHILMEGTPPELDPALIRTTMESIEGVESVHDLHVWSLTSGFHSLSAHVVADHCDPHPNVASGVREMLERVYDLGHVTVQLEDPCNPCTDVHD